MKKGINQAVNQHFFFCLWLRQPSQPLIYFLHGRSEFTLPLLVLTYISKWGGAVDVVLKWQRISNSVFQTAQQLSPVTCSPWATATPYDDEFMMRWIEEEEMDICCQGETHVACTVLWCCSQIQVQREKRWSCWWHVALLMNFGKWVMSRLRFLCLC